VIARRLQPPRGQTICAAMVVLRPSLSRKAAGWTLLVLGVLGMVLPFLQGFLFLALGVFILRDQHIWAAQRWGWVADRWPHQVGRIEAMEASLGRRLVGAGDRIRRLFTRA
jgi:predicted PurR-regulated permease PerM